MNLADILTGIGRLTKQFNVVVERVDRLDNEEKRTRADCDDMRKQIAALTARIAVLEEGRKTTAAEVKLALIETISAWENQKLRDELDRMKHQLPPSPQA